MNVDYITEINGLDDWEHGNPLSATAYKVMRKLQKFAYDQGFPEKIRVANTVLCSDVGCGENTLVAARQQLIQRGLIEYKGSKKQIPTYTILYFSHNPIYNRKYRGYTVGINRGNIQGIDMGIVSGISGGQNIYNDDEDDLEEEDVNTTDNIPAEDQAIDTSPLHYPAPVIPFVGVNGRAREGKQRLIYPPRHRKLMESEMRTLAAIHTFLATERGQWLFRANMPLLQQVLESDRFPMELVFHALSLTERRDQKYSTPLVNPLAYTLKLLEDWEERGYKTVRQINEAKDNYWDDY